MAATQQGSRKVVPWLPQTVIHPEAPSSLALPFDFLRELHHLNNFAFAKLADCLAIRYGFGVGAVLSTFVSFGSHAADPRHRKVFFHQYDQCAIDIKSQAQVAFSAQVLCTIVQTGRSSWLRQTPPLTPLIKVGDFQMGLASHAVW